MRDDFRQNAMLDADNEAGPSSKRLRDEPQQNQARDEQGFGQSAQYDVVDLTGIDSS